MPQWRILTHGPQTGPAYYLTYSPTYHCPFVSGLKSSRCEIGCLSFTQRIRRKLCMKINCVKDGVDIKLFYPLLRSPTVIHWAVLYSVTSCRKMLMDSPLNLLSHYASPRCPPVTICLLYSFTAHMQCDSTRAGFNCRALSPSTKRSPTPQFGTEEVSR